MPYDPNDPNQGSQAPASGTQDQSDPQWQAAITQPFNDRIKQDPVIAQWLTAHNGGQNLSPSDQQALISLIGQRTPGLQTQYLSVGSDGTVNIAAPPNSFGPDLLKGAAVVLGPILAAALIPALAGGAGAGGAAAGATEGADAATAGGVGVGETATTTGLASGAGLPGAVAAPTVGDSAATNAAFDASGNFTGDTYGDYSGPSGSSSILQSAGDVGKALTAFGAASATGRGQEANIGQNQDRNAIGLYTAEQNANTAANNFGINRGSLANQYANTDLAQRKFQLTAPGERAGNAVRGDILSRAQDVTFSGLPAGIHPPTISGGLRPSMFSGDTRALGANMTSSALAAQQKGDTFAPLPALPTYQAGPAAPTLTPIPQASGLDKTATGVGTALSLAPTFAQLLKQYAGNS